MMWKKKTLIILSAVLLLAGCKPEADNKVIEFVKKTKTEKTPYHSLLPALPKPSHFKYAASDLRNPFETFFVPKSTDTDETLAGPNLKREREVMESYPLDSLSMVGTIERQGVFYVLLKDNTGSIHRANIGNYVGQNSGQIEKISDIETEVKEWLSDGKGGWREHIVTIPLVDTKGKEKGV